MERAAKEPWMAPPPGGPGADPGRCGRRVVSRGPAAAVAAGGRCAPHSSRTLRALPAPRRRPPLAGIPRSGAACAAACRSRAGAGRPGSDPHLQARVRTGGVDGARWRFRRFATYPICRWSGALGPKIAEGTGKRRKASTGRVRAALNPNSRFTARSIWAFPMPIDRAHGRTGSFLMVHGGCASVGCYAMTDAQMR